MKSKKSQLEMIGIAIVIVMIVLGMLFVLKSMIKPPIQTHSKFVRTHITYDILLTVSLSDADCGGMTMGEVLKACAEGDVVNCGDGDGCKVFKNNIQKILNATLKKQKLDYRLRAYTSTNPPKDSGGSLGDIFMASSCSENALVKEKPGILIIPSNVGDIKLMLEICSVA
ncbi:MAG: hypothetical protein N3D84_01200 [Candidatus Woesearchaeota archaeon]|nr:hypothetical protein [Candidatus Woesearchaeota archaeon]